MIGNSIRKINKFKINYFNKCRYFESNNCSSNPCSSCPRNDTDDDYIKKDNKFVVLNKNNKCQTNVGQLKQANI